MVTVRRTESHQCGHEDHRVARVRDFCHLLHGGGGIKELQAIAQPLYCRPGDEDAALQCILRPRVQRGGDRAQQPMPRADRPIADVLQEERARAVGALGVARSEASLAEERCLLVPSHAGDWQSVREKTEPRRDAIIRGTWPNIRQHSFRHAEVPAQFLVPRGCLQVQEQRARSVRHVGRVHAPAGEAPDEITINRAPGELAGLGTFSQLCIMT